MSNNGSHWVESVAEEIVLAARDVMADLIVLPAHHRALLGHTLFANTADKIARHAPCPVLMVPVPPPRGKTRGRSSVNNVQHQIVTPKATFLTPWKNENSRITFEKSQIANYRRRCAMAFFRCILLQRNALPTFSVRKAGGMSLAETSPDCV